MQKRGVASPDDGDALALTFAAPVRFGGAVKATKYGRVKEASGPMAWAG